MPRSFTVSGRAERLPFRCRVELREQGPAVPLLARGSWMQLLEQVHDRGGDDLGRVGLEVARPRAPGLVAAEFMLPGRGQVAIVPVGELYVERVVEGAFGLDLEPHLREHLAAVSYTPLTLPTIYPV